VRRRTHPFHRTEQAGPSHFPTSGDALLVTWFGLGAFAAYGIALGAVTWSYLRRTQPVCANTTAEVRS
jgi:hypothetical protein